LFQLLRRKLRRFVAFHHTDHQRAFNGLGHRAGIVDPLHGVDEHDIDSGLPIALGTSDGFVGVRTSLGRRSDR